MAVSERILHRLRAKAGARSRSRGTAFVLSGGGTYGAVQLGQIRALFEADIVPDMIVGTSIGAINGAGIAAWPTRDGLERLIDIWLGMGTEDIFPGGAWRRAWSAVRKGDHLHPNTGLRRIVGRIQATRFEELSIPLAVVAAHLATGTEKIFSSGPLAPALLASAALPAVFPPVTVDGEQYTDGGVVNNTPISVAVNAGAERVIVITCGRTNLIEREVRRPLDVMVQAFAHSRAHRIEHDLERYRETLPLEVIPISDPPTLRYDDLSHTAALIEQGETETRRWLENNDPFARW